ncbi:MAG: InlB B-repeat-containing protein [Dehalococcoidia bacterium]
MRTRKKVLLLITPILVGVLLISSVPASGGHNLELVISLTEARTALEADLLPLAGAGFAGIAHSPGEREIIVFVEDEQAKREVPSSFAGYAVKTEVTGRIESLATEVVEPVAGVSEDRQSAVRPLMGGISLSAYVTKGGLIYLYAGTLGMVTYDGKILSNAHVVAMEPRSDRFLENGTPITQPGTGDRGRLPNRVGELEVYVPIDFGSNARNYADAAIGSIDDDVDLSPGEQFGEEGNYWVEGWTGVSKGDVVRKSGRTTGVTMGEVVHVSASFLVWYGDQSAYFVDQIVVTQEDWSFAASGDSGSGVDREGEFVGLVFAGSETHAVISKAEHIIDALGIAVGPQENVSYLTVSSTAGGAVTVPGEGVFPYDLQEVVTLVAEPDDGFRFVEWTGDVATIADVGAAETTITMDGDYSVGAKFELMPGLHSLTISGTEGGSVVQPGEATFAYDDGAVVELVAEADDGYRFAGWTGDTATVEDVGADETTITMDGDYAITASFELISDLYRLTISSTAGGSVTEPGEGIFIRTAGTVVTLVAEPAEGYRFVKWTGDVDTIVDVYASRTAVTMHDSYSITANFETWPELVAVLTISSTQGGSVTIPGEGEFSCTLGSKISLAAEAENGYRFVGWSGDADTIADATNTSTTIVMDSSYSIEAGFDRVGSSCCSCTAAYDTPMAGQLVVLREFRDEYLLTNTGGRAFAGFYYAISPPIAEFITAHPKLKPMVRTGLLPAVAMSALALDTTPYQKSAILGLPVVSVAMIVWVLRRRRGTQEAS